MILSRSSKSNVCFLYGCSRDYVKKYKNSLLFKLQDSQGNTIDLWVSYDAEHATRYRDKIVVRGAKPGSEW